ncbi:MAG: nicotinate (nicotinamide) nucleotide adenylyltransferase [Myxococcales bacterium]|nr:nicotinate (nicotinamide) nucleotide adenylyltransferase [Myxococcales bacterium]
MARNDDTLGIFGGSFDPPHLAHVLVVAYVLSASHVNRVLVIPTFLHPFAKELAPYPHRMKMCELAFADLRRVEVSGIEGTLGGESRTVRTIEALSKRNQALRLILGSDLIEETSRWHRFDRISALAPPLVIPRASDTANNPFGIPGISSTRIRERLRKGETLHGLLPEPVLDYIERNDLYRNQMS